MELNKNQPTFLHQVLKIHQSKNELKSHFQTNHQKTKLKTILAVFNWLLLNSNVLILGLDSQKSFFLFFFFYINRHHFITFSSHLKLSNILGRGNSDRHNILWRQMGGRAKQVLRSTILSSTIILIFFDNSRMGRF